jgi:hypothetical protein
METKKCNCCSVVFPIEDFAFKNKAEGIRINFCSNCRKIKSKSSYEKHKQTNLHLTIIYWMTSLQSQGQHLH